jgi:AraC family transcriptional regulator
MTATATHDDPPAAAHTHARQQAPKEMARIMDAPPILVPEVLRDGTRLTQRWAHGPINAYMHGMNGHVVVASYGEEVDMCWRVENRRLVSRARRRGFTLIPEGLDGRWDFGGGVTVSHVYLPAERLQSCADLLASGKPVELVPRVGFEDPTTARLLRILSQEAAQSDACSRLFVEQAIDLLCIHLVRAHSSFGVLALPVPRRGLADWQVKRVTEFMREHLDRDIGLSELAGVLNLSRFHFCTAFRFATGCTPYQWLTRERMKRAQRLLADRKLSIIDIALSVGYQTPSAFATAFRKTVGATPSAFRRTL